MTSNSLRKIYLLICLLFLTSFTYLVNAQEVFMGQAKKFNFRYSQYGIIGKINQKNVIYRSNDNIYTLDVYNDSMKLLFSVPLDFLTKKTTQVEFISLRDKIGCLYVIDEKGNLTVYGTIFNEKGEILVPKKKIFEEKKTWFSNSSTAFEFKSSADKNNTAIMSHGGKKNDDFVYIVIDSLLNSKWQGTTKITSKELGDYIAYNYMEISNTGYIFFPCFSTNNSGTLYDVDVIVLDPNFPETYKHIEIGGDKIYFNDLIIRINNVENYCQVSGTYKTNKNGKIEGLYSTRISFSSEAPSTHLTEFSEEFLKGIKSKNYKKAFNDYRIQEIIFRKDGGYVLVAEEQNFEIKNVYQGGYMGFNNFYSDPSYVTTNKEYTFGNIIIINMDKEGNILWTEHIRKFQKTRDDNGDFSSYTLLNSGQNLVFIYNQFNSADQSIGLSSIDHTGFIQLSRLNSVQRYEEWMIKGGVQIAPLQVMIPLYGTGELNFSLVDFSK